MMFGYEVNEHVMIERDKNHACVVMWSIANEPASMKRRKSLF